MNGTVKVYNNFTFSPSADYTLITYCARYLIHCSQILMNRGLFSMKTIRLLIVATLLALVATLIPQVTTQAATKVTSQTIVVTEAQINASTRIMNPVRRSVKNAHVTLG